MRGIETTKFQTSLTKLSRTMEQAKAGSAGATKALDALGVSHQAIATGDVQRVLLESADAYAAMENPAQKAALAQQLFGRQALALTPLLAGGSQGIQEQLDTAKRFGAVMGEDGVGSVKEMAGANRDMKLAMEGLRVTFATDLLPAITDVVMALASITRTLQPLLRNTTVVRIALGLLVAGFIALKVASIAAIIAASPITLTMAAIVIGVLAVIAIFVLLYKKVGWFRDGVNAAFSWIKNNWPLLLSILTGPIGAAVIYIIRHFNEVVDFVKGMPGKIASAASGMWDGITDAFKAAV